MTQIKIKTPVFVRKISTSAKKIANNNPKVLNALKCGFVAQACNAAALKYGVPPIDARNILLTKALFMQNLGILITKFILKRKK